MTEVRTELLRAARSRLGGPFRHHYKPYNLCDNGRSPVPECGERGLDPLVGFDCSGLVIASMCDVLGIPTDKWPWTLRHTIHIGRFACEYGDGSSGDVLIMYNRFPNFTKLHMGITSEGATIHANSYAHEVTEGTVADMPVHFYIPAARMAELAMQQAATVASGE